MFYAELNSENICIGVKLTHEPIHSDTHIAINAVDEDYLYKKYENGEWSKEQFLPNYPQIQLDRVETLEDIANSLGQALVDIKIQFMVGGGI